MANKIDYDKWQNWHWESETKYYKLSFVQNLFGEWIIIKKWGSRNTRIHGAKTFYCSSTDEIDEVFAAVHKKRVSRGYALMS